MNSTPTATTKANSRMETIWNEMSVKAPNAEVNPTSINGIKSVISNQLSVISNLILVFGEQY